MILITGAASGMGKAIAEEVSSAGKSLILADINADAVSELATSLSAPGRWHHPLYLDVADPASIDAASKELSQRDVKLTGAFIGAGIWNPAHDRLYKAGTKDQFDAWNRVMDVNLRGTYLTASLALDLMETGGSIVTVSSVVAMAAQPKSFAYTASKGGVMAFTRPLALEGARKGVRVNCIAPGAIATPMTEAALKHSAPVNMLGRAGTAKEIASVARFLLSDEASFITGAIIPVDGGATAI